MLVIASEFKRLWWVGFICTDAWETVFRHLGCDDLLGHLEKLRALGSFTNNVSFLWNLEIARYVKQRHRHTRTHTRTQKERERERERERKRERERERREAWLNLSKS